MKFPQVWDLDRSFKGGSSSSDFQTTYKDIEKKVATLKELLNSEQLSEAISLYQGMSITIREMETFVLCLGSQDVYDTKARALEVKMRALLTTFENLSILLNEKLAQLTESTFDSLLKSHQDITFLLTERRNLAKERLSFKEESLINDLAMDGYHGWSQLWSTVIGEMTFPFQNETLSFGQIENKMSHPKRSIRQQAFDSITKQFSKHQSLFAQNLNHLSGFRLQTYEKRGWENFLHEPMNENRMTQKTLTAMWETIEKNQAPLKAYLECKAALLKIDKLSWFDLEAPIGETDKKISYDDASSFIVTQFGKFSPTMGDFAKRALEGGWIDAEDRKGKSPGGFCCALPIEKESRIFMTFSNTMTNLFTLAHELGHAFHNEVIFPLPEMAQHPKMNVAETASTMAEMIVTKASIEQETDPKERLCLLDDHLSRAVAYLMNIYARFLFETSFYEERQRGFVSHERLNLLMENAQKKAYGNSLETYHPLFWAGKMHFFFSDVPFYNFPYTFGYLFSLGIHTLSQKEQSFEDQYISILKDTGQMSVEELAKKHLQVDLETNNFWQLGLDSIKEDVKTFTELAKSCI